MPPLYLCPCICSCTHGHACTHAIAIPTPSPSPVGCDTQRHLINEVYFSFDDIADAAKASDKEAAKAGWLRAKDYLNGYLRIVNFPISSKVGDKFTLIDATL